MDDFMSTTNKIIKRIKARVNKRNQNALCLVIGETGSGKSYSALQLAKAVDPKFDISRCVFTAEDFLRLVNRDGKYRVKKGQAIIWDEMGSLAGANAREAMAIKNRCISYLAQTFRYRNFVVFFTVPGYKFIDLQVRRLIHFIFETVKINYEKKLCILKPLRCEANPRSGVVYNKYMYAYDKKMNLVRITRMYVPKPPKPLIKKYEEKRSYYMDQQNEDILEKLMNKKYEDQKKIDKNKQEIIEKRKKLKEIVQKVIKNHKKYLTSTKQTFSSSIIKFEFGLKTDESKYVKNKAESIFFRKQEL